jgi:hypothetical protein
MITPSTVLAIEGAVITCPECRTVIGTLVKTIYQAWRLGLDAIRFEPGQFPAGHKAACRQCGTTYAEIDLRLSGTKRVETMYLHTSHGWLPKAPPGVTAPKRVPIGAP